MVVSYHVDTENWNLDPSGRAASAPTLVSSPDQASNRFASLANSSLAPGSIFFYHWTEFLGANQGILFTSVSPTSITVSRQ